MLIPNSVELNRKSLEKPLPDPDRGYVILLGGQTIYLFIYLLPLTIIFNPDIQVCARVLVHPILVNSEEIVIGNHEAISGEVAIYY